MQEKQKYHGWWQTLPGILTATAGIITAVTGLILAVNRAVFQTENRRIVPSQITPIRSSEPMKPPEVPRTSPSAAVASSTDQPLQNPGTLSSGAEVKIDLVVFKIVAGRLDNHNKEKPTLRFTIRMTNNKNIGANFTDESCRLLVDGVPRAPISELYVTVASHSSLDADFVFVTPAGTPSVALQFWYQGESDQVPVDVSGATH